MKGEIYSLEAYARGKLLDHSGWCEVLPRGITPSDIDFVMDNNGRVLLGELNSRSCEWSLLPFGQRKVYESLVGAGAGNIVAVCCQHAIPSEGEKINTVTDVLRFQWLYLNREGYVVPSRVCDGSLWVRFVYNWFAP